MGIEEEIREALFAAKDEGYKDFHKKLVPTVDEARIIGVRMPQQRRIAQVYKKDARMLEYLMLSSHKYVEEVNVHGFLLDGLRNFEDCLEQFEHLLPMVDNWANCDSLMPKLFKKNPDLVLARAEVWLKSDEVYTVRAGILMYMRLALDERFDEAQLEKIAVCCNDEYYINMAVAWYFSMALAKQYDKTLPWMKERRLPEWVHRKSIQKAVESRQVSEEHKKELKGYR